MTRMMSIVLLGLALAGCTSSMGNPLGVEDPRTVGRQPREYDSFDGRIQGAVFQGNTARNGRPATDPMAMLDRPEARQKDVLERLQKHYERLSNDDSHRAVAANDWLAKFLADHDDIPPDQPLQVENALLSMQKVRERAAERLTKEEKDSVKRVVQDGLTKLEDRIAKMKTYQAELPARDKEYKAKIAEVNDANERMRLWAARHNRVTNTLLWHKETQGDADAEINLQLKAVAELLTHKDELTRILSMNWFADLGGADAEQVLPPLMKIATDRAESEPVRNAAVKAVEKIETQPQQSSGQ